MASRTLHLTPAGPDRVHGTLVTLNRRAAARHDRSAQPLASFARAHLESRGVTVASPVLAHRLLTRAVAQERPVGSPGTLARAFGASVRELLRAEADLDVLARDDVPRVRELANVTARYRALLREHRLVDGAEILAVAAKTAAPLGPLTLFGYVRLTVDELLLLDALAGDGSHVYLPWTDHGLFEDNAEAGRWLASRGWTVVRDEAALGAHTAAFLGERRALPHVTVRACSHMDAEVRAALTDVKRLHAGGVPLHDIALVVSDDAVWGPLVQTVAWEYGLTVDVTAAVPLGETRVGSWINRALDVVERGATFERGARLLGHPLDQGVAPDVWRRVRAARPEHPDAWRSLGVTFDALDWPHHDERAGWVRRLTTLLDTRDVTARAETRGPLDQEAAVTLRRELAALAEPASEPLARDAFIEELRTLVALLAVTPRPSGTALELLTPYALIGGAARHVLVLGLAEGAWPAPLQDDGLLDFVERQRLRRAGVPLDVPSSLARRDLLSFWGLLDAAQGQLTLSYSQRTPKGDETLPSAYLTRLGVTPGPYRHTAACSPEEFRRAHLQRGAQDEVLTHARHAHAVECRREGEPTFDEYDGHTGLGIDLSTRTFSASGLRILGTCAFRWWLSAHLRLGALEDDEDDTVGLGQLQHAALRRAAEHVRAQPHEDARRVMLGALDEALGEAERELGWPQTPEWTLRRPEVRERLRRMIEAPRFIDPNAVIRLTEATFEGVWRGFRVRGQVDRIDDLGGKFVVVDYKSGKSKPWGAQDTDRKLSLDLQLPIYQQVALPALIPGAKPGGAHYLSVRTGDVIGRLALSEAALDAFATRARRTLETGAFVPSPDVQGKACGRCPYPAVCRGGPRLSRKDAP